MLEKFGENGFPHWHLNYTDDNADTDLSFNLLNLGHNENAEFFPNFFGQLIRKRNFWKKICNHKKFWIIIFWKF